MKTILLIDDDLQLLELYQEMLDSRGYLVATAENGVVGLNLFRQSGWDLVITDIIMPEMEGLESIRAIRRLKPRQKIVAISGGGRFSYATEVLQTAHDLGADRILTKPVGMEELFQTVQGLIGPPKGEGNPPAVP